MIRICLALVLIIGVALRALPGVVADFPLNDGGLLYAPIHDFQRVGLTGFPLFTAYNGGVIPFAHPPLALYLVAALAEMSGMDVLWLFRAFPLVWSVLTLPAFWLLARALLPTRSGVAVAVAAFALLPAAFQTSIMGGGVARAPGFLCGLLALWQAVRMLQQGSFRHAAATGFLAGLTLLFDVESTRFLAISMITLGLALGRRRDALPRLALVGVVALIVAAPWLGRMALTSGFAPFFSALSSGAFALIAFRPTPPFNALAAILTMLGFVLSIGLVVAPDRRAFFLGWLIAIYIFDTRSIYPHSAPAVCLGLGSLLGSAPVGPVREWGSVSSVTGRTSEWAPVASLASGAATAIVLLAFIVLRYLLPLPGELASLRPLSQDERVTMRWVADNTPPSSRFLVISGDFWGYDRTGEWFPALTGRTNFLIPQGMEWVPGGAFSARIALHEGAQACGNQDANCLARWSRTNQVTYDHVYIARRSGRSCCDVLRAALRADPAYTLLYDGPGATIFGRSPTT